MKPVVRLGQSGQVAVEYLLLSAMIALVFLSDQGALLEQLLSAIQKHYARFTYGISLP